VCQFYNLNYDPPPLFFWCIPKETFIRITKSPAHTTRTSQDDQYIPIFFCSLFLFFRIWFLYILDEHPSELQKVQHILPKHRKTINTSPYSVVLFFFPRFFFVYSKWASIRIARRPAHTTKTSQEYQHTLIFSCSLFWILFCAFQMSIHQNYKRISTYYQKIARRSTHPHVPLFSFFFFLDFFFFFSLESIKI